MLKMCLRNPMVRCEEICFGDDCYCETVMFLGYPEENIKYPNSYEIDMFSTHSMVCCNPFRPNTYTCDMCKQYWTNDDDCDYSDDYTQEDWLADMEANALEYSSVDVYCSEIVTESDEEIDVWEIDDDGIPF